MTAEICVVCRSRRAPAGHYICRDCLDALPARIKRIYTRTGNHGVRRHLAVRIGRTVRAS